MATTAHSPLDSSEPRSPAAVSRCLLRSNAKACPRRSIRPRLSLDAGGSAQFPHPTHVANPALAMIVEGNGYTAVGEAQGNGLARLSPADGRGDYFLVVADWVPRCGPGTFRGFRLRAFEPGAAPQQPNTLDHVPPPGLSGAPASASSTASAPSAPDRVDRVFNQYDVQSPSIRRRLQSSCEQTI